MAMPALGEDYRRNGVSWESLVGRTSCEPPFRKGFHTGFIIELSKLLRIGSNEPRPTIPDCADVAGPPDHTPSRRYADPYLLQPRPYPIQVIVQYPHPPGFIVELVPESRIDPQRF